MIIFETFLIFVLGLCIGSFLNVAIDRLPWGRSLSGRSHCDYCKKTLSIIDLIPFVSFFLQKGKCRYCKKPISFYYPLVEIFTGFLFILVWFYFVEEPLIIRVSYIGIISSFIVIFFSDLKYHIIPDEAQVATIIFSIPVVINQKILFSNIFETPIFAGFVTASILFAIYAVSNGAWMGFGDVKFAFCMGFLLGLKGGFLALYIAFVIGGIISLILMILKKKVLKSQIAFGPFLVIGSVFVLFFKQQIFDILIL